MDHQILIYSFPSNCPSKIKKESVAILIWRSMVIGLQMRQFIYLFVVNIWKIILKVYFKLKRIYRWTNLKLKYEFLLTLKLILYCTYCCLTIKLGVYISTAFNQNMIWIIIKICLSIINNISPCNIMLLNITIRDMHY